MTRKDLTFRAALSRLVLGVAAAALLPLVYPAVAQRLWMFALYLAVAVVEQVLIRRDIGGRVRSLAAGVVDAAFITAMVHWLGSTGTVFAALYFFAGVMNALVVGLRVGFALSTVSSIFFGLTVWAEHTGRLPYAPDVAAQAALGPPTFAQAMVAGTFVTVFSLASTTIVGLLVTALRHHEKELEEANRRLEDLSHRDPLTNLYNRRFVFSQLELELARAKRGNPMALLMLDLDGFKRVNDTQGHLRGDMLLKEIARAFADSTRKGDVAARYGGDEFVLLLPSTTALEARAIADRVAAAVRDVGARFDAQRPVTASVGLACATRDDHVASLLRRADENAYRAKQSGGDCVVLEDRTGE